MFFVGIFRAHDGMDVSFVYSGDRETSHFDSQNDFRLEKLLKVVYAETRELLNGAIKDALKTLNVEK